MTTRKEDVMSEQKIQRAELGVDGNCGFALLGENIQEGEAEFVEVVQMKDEPLHAAEARAAAKAYRALKSRLGLEHLSYFIGESHPRYC
jgi:hypothetical protein